MKGAGLMVNIVKMREKAWMVVAFQSMTARQNAERIFVEKATGLHRCTRLQLFMYCNS